MACSTMYMKCASTSLVWAAGCRRFLNRLLGLPAARQNLLFAYFTAALGAEIRAAKAEGCYFASICDLGGSHVAHAEPKVRACCNCPV